MSFDVESRGEGFGLGRAAAGVRRAVSGAPGARALEALRAGLGDGPFALVMLFVSPDRDREALAAALPGAFGDAVVIGCTTAGEIGPEGYAGGGIAAVGLPRGDFAATTRTIDAAGGVRLSDAAALAREMQGELERRLAETARPLGRRFGLMLSDGAAAGEDALAFAFGEALGPAPFLGGSAGDADGIGPGFVLSGGRFASGGATLALVETRCRPAPLRLDRMRAGEPRMVVTGADASGRRVTELNGEPAAEEYARLAGLSVNALDAAALAAHPLAAAAGGRLHPRALRGADPDGALRFAAAVEEGMVLRLAEPPDVAAELEDALGDLSRGGAPEATLVFESVLRRREAEASQAAARVSAAFAAANAVGFTSWGEQAGRLHGSGTLSALALYPPEGGSPSTPGGAP